MKGITMNAKQSFKMFIVVLGAILFLQTSSLMADVVNTDQMAAQNQREVEKFKLQSFVEREEVKVRLQALGVEETIAKVRVAAMTDQEVHAVAQKMDSMPAGGRLNNSDAVLILLIIILILII